MPKAGAETNIEFCISLYMFLFIYLFVLFFFNFYPHPQMFSFAFLQRGRGREKQWCKRNTDWLLSFAPRLGIHAGTRDHKHPNQVSHIPPHRLGINLQSRYVPWQGIKPTTLWLQDDTTITEPHWQGYFVQTIFQI